MNMLTAILQNNPLVNALTAPVALFTRRRDGCVLDYDLNPGFSFVDLPLDAERTCLFFGSVSFLKCGLANDQIRPALSWSEDAFTASRWQEWFGPDYLGSQGQQMPARDVASALATGPMAVRPNLGLKKFQGGVYAPETWPDVSVDSDFPCFVSPISIIEAEYRVWIVENRPVAASRYRYQDRAAKDQIGVSDAMRTAGGILAGRSPLPVIVVDLAVTDQGWRIIEFNCIHTSGWHAVDPDIVLASLADMEKPRMPTGSEALISASALSSA